MSTALHPVEEAQFLQVPSQSSLLLPGLAAVRQARRPHIHAEHLHRRLRSAHVAARSEQRDELHRLELRVACCLQISTLESGDHPVIDRRGEVVAAAHRAGRAERQRREDVAQERRSNLLRKELAWLRRGAPARTSKPKFRIAAAEALIAHVPPPRDSVNLAQTASARLGKKVVNIHDASFAPAEHEPAVFDSVTWNLAPGTRYGLLGPNGIGKTTLLNAIAEAAGAHVDSHPDKRHGRIEVGTTVVVGVLSQMADETPTDVQVLAYVESLRPMVEVDGNDISARSLLERFGFAGNRLTTFIRDLSGGERRRLALLTVLLAGPNVLLLDEPTNDLDTDTAAEFEDLLDTWQIGRAHV